MNLMEILLALAFLLVAILYSSVGHAGGTGYLTSMALLGFSPESMKPTAIVLNIVVGAIGLFRFASAGHIKLRNVLPFAIASIPAVYFATKMHFTAPSYALVLGILIMIGAIGMFAQAERADTLDARAAVNKMPMLAAIFAGGCIGLFSAMTGTGGAVILTPLILLAGWMPTREAFGTSVVIVWLNSLLAFWMLEAPTYPSQLPYWAIIVAIGALIGTQLGIRVLSTRTLRWMVGAVMVIGAARLLLLG